jgi:lipoprotein-anchoring transpeptidase ErfK/SrfK
VAEVEAPPVPVLDPGSWYAATTFERVVLVSREPGGAPYWRFDTRNGFGQRISMLATAARADLKGRPWVRVTLPVGLDGRRGWIPAEQVRLREQQHRIVVDLSERELRWKRNGDRVASYRVGIGSSATPTPTGTFYVWARVPQTSPSGPYGAFALGLSAFSPDFPGDRIAIHGTDDASDLGLQVSNGCIRVFNPDMLNLRRVPLGTPVIVHD